jgi:bifunctional DNA-binding transcriptional regulator/antitoxin component of YhaV-PrlF toxin-antitoxin module
MTQRVGPKGQVVIPKDIREALGATLLTGDPELLEREMGCRMRDLRGR